MSTTVVIFGPKASGKSSNAARLLAHFGCIRLVDNWDGRAPIKEGDLLLTEREPPFRAKGAIVLHIAEALQRLVAATRRKGFQP